MLLQEKPQSQTLLVTFPESALRCLVFIKQTQTQMSVFCTFAAKSWKRKAFNLGCRGSAAFLLKSNTLQSLWGGVQTVFKNFSWSYQRNNKWSTWSWGFLPGCSRPSGNTCNRKTKQEKTAFLQMWSYEMMTLVENIWTKYYVKYAEVYF